MLNAYDYAGNEVTLVHADDQRLLRMAVFDVIVNNADRKGGHILAGVDGRVYGVDHGVSLHVQDKLRTVLWGWAGKPIDDETLSADHKLYCATASGPASFTTAIAPGASVSATIASAATPAAGTTHTSERSYAAFTGSRVAKSTDCNGRRRVEIGFR